MIGDGFCNDETNNVDCGFDGGDCCGSCVVTKLCTECACLNNATGNGVLNPLVGDGFCHDELNTINCDFDSGDCCGSCVVTESCSECACLDKNNDDVMNVLVGNNICNDETNNANCNFDGGDCCLDQFASRNKCSECICYNIESCPVEFQILLGNGVCNNETNNIECSLDFGDCCPISDKVGNEICNDEANIPECNFDGGDCCLYPMNQNECSECKCYFDGVIASYIYLDNDNLVKHNYIDLTWLIQLPIGQYIKIDFLSFHSESCR